MRPSRQMLCLVMVISMMALALSWYFIVQMADDPFPIRRQKRSKSLESLRRKQEISHDEERFLNSKYGGRQAGFHGRNDGSLVEVEAEPAGRSQVQHPAHPHMSGRVTRPEEMIRQAASQRHVNGVYD